MFVDQCRADHEPERPATVKVMYDHFVGKISDANLQQSYVARDRQLMLDLESNCFLAYRPDLLRSTFPDSKFIVLIREPIHWLNSILDNNINFPKGKTPTMTKWHAVLFHGQTGPQSDNDDFLVSRGLYPVHFYLEYWVRTYDRCLRSLQNSHLLKVGTNQISNRASEISEFVGVDVGCSSTAETHSNKTTAKHRVMDQLDRARINKDVDRICGSLIDEFNIDKLWI